jgi:hypothetical protein
VSLTITPISFAEAARYVEDHHRHHRAPVGHLFSLAVANDAREVVGVCIVGRPVARAYQDGFTCEVTRTATDGTRNANSILYGAAWRAARALGYRRLITYTMAGETGASLRAAGWRDVARRRPRAGWDAPGRPRVDTHPTGVERTLWEAGDEAAE